MKKRMIFCLSLSLFLLLSLGSSLPALSALPERGDDDQDEVGAVYTMTNDPSGNAVLAFNRSARGALTFMGSFSTGGLGTGGREPDFGLANAGALALSDDNHLLFVVNPGSDDISVFAVLRNGLRLLDRKNSGGHQPISVTVNKDLLYVLNAGGNVGARDNITAFTVDSDGRLTHLSDSTRPLSADVTAPAQILFNKDGKVLIVTEKATDIIDSYTVGRDGRATGPRLTFSLAQNPPAQTPFGMDFGQRNQLFVSDDFNDAPGAGALSSYMVARDGSLQVVSSAVPAHESGACWVEVSHDGRYAYVANTVSSTISLYGIDAQSGRVDFRMAFPSLIGPTDMDFSRNGQYLYALTPDQIGGGSPGINVFRVNRQDGSLVALPGVTGLPLSIDGLVAR